MKKLQEAIADKTIPFAYHKNQPGLDFLNVIKKSDKAIYVNLDGTNEELWLPLSAFESFAIQGQTIFTLKQWFKSSLKNWQLEKLNV